MKFPYHVAPEQRTPYPPFDELPTIEADTPMAAIARLAKDGRLPAAGESFWVRIVVESENGRPKRAVAMQLTPEFEIPLDWQPPEDW